MSLRSWAIRGFILAGVASLAAFGWIANSWVSPERVRAQVIATLDEQLDGVDVHVGSAHMRILGGIAVSDLRLTRRLPDGGESPVLAVPSAVLYHDKEQLNRGRLIIKKVELEHPELHLERGADGKWNVAEISKQGPADKPVPTFVVKGGTIHISDRGPDPVPSVTLTDANLTLLNDPLPVLAIQARALAAGYGGVNVRARVNRLTGALSLGLEMADFPLGHVAADAAKKFAPELAKHLGGLTSTASVSADLTYLPEAGQKWRHDIRLDLKESRFTHPDLPWPVEKIAASVRVVDGRVKVDNATATITGAEVRLKSLETRAEGRFGVDGQKRDEDSLARLEDHLQRIDVEVTGVPLDDALFKQLPEKARLARKMFAPKGSVDLGYRFACDANGWKREVEVRPQQIAMTYEKFRYPVADVGGRVKRTTTHAGTPATSIDLIGTAGGQRITIKGTIVGDGDDPGINLRVSGANMPIDQTLFAAFPEKYAKLVRQFHAAGRGDFVAEISQQPGVNLCENEFRIDIRDATANYEQFPYPLEKVKGRLVVRVSATDAGRPNRPGEPLAAPPDRDEIVLDGFTAVHAGAAVWLNGSKRPMPGSRDRKLTLHVGGNHCPVDADMRSALAKLGVDAIWTTFEPRGKLSFAANVELIDRAPPLDRPDLNPPINPATDLKMTFNFSGPTVTPNFFPYELTNLTGWLEYKNSRVDVAHIEGRHGETRVTIGAGEVRFFPDGIVWANLGGVEVRPFVADAAFLKALPGKLGPGLESLELRGSAELLVKHLVVLTPPDSKILSSNPLPRVPPPTAPAVKGVGARSVPAIRAQSPASSAEPDPVVYFDAEVKLTGATLDTGVAWTDVFGAVACRGRYEGTHMGLLRGALWFDSAVIARQPVTRLSGRVRAAPQQVNPHVRGDYLPTELEFTDLAGDYFHGVLGGEGRVVLADRTRFDLWLTATDVQLEEVARYYKLGSDADLKGIAQTQLRLQNRLDSKTGQLVVDGTGKIDVPTGRMYNLPVLLDLVKVLKLQAPDKTAFEEAHAVFKIHGDRIKVEQVDLIGKAICLGGSGELDTSGEYVKFDFYTVGSQVLARLVNTPVGDLTAFLSKNLFKIKLTRENGELKYKPEPVPIVTEPARAAADRLRARAAKVFGSMSGTGGTKDEKK
jgi:hypothetical protein